MTDNQKQEPQTESKNSENESLFTVQELTLMAINAQRQPNDVGIVSWGCEELNEH